MPNFILNGLPRYYTHQADIEPDLIAARIFGMELDPTILRLPDRDLRITHVAGFSSKADEAALHFQDAIGGLSTEAQVEVWVFQVEDITSPGLEE